MLKSVALLASAFAVFQYAFTERASKNDGPIPEIRVVRSDANARLLMLGSNEALAIDVPADIKEILVGDLETVRVVVRTLRRVHIVGASVGRTHIVFYDDHDRQILVLDVSVSPQMGLPQQLTQSFAALI
jgi:Flp pilus assembly secretin CpaC